MKTEYASVQEKGIDFRVGETVKERLERDQS